MKKRMFSTILNYAVTTPWLLALILLLLATQSILVLINEGEKPEDVKMLRTFSFWLAVGILIFLTLGGIFSAINEGNYNN